MRIATLIPAYKPAYLTDLLVGLRHQTVKPSLIVISDDSPDQAFVRQLNSEPFKSALADLPLEVIPGPRSGAYNNFRHLMQVWAGRSELVHLLLDDDVIYPEFYARHQAAHALGRFNVSVSRRWTALENGQPTGKLNPPAVVDQSPQRMLAIQAPSLFASTVAVSSNWLGEFSNAVFRGEFVPQLDSPTLDGIDFTGLEDLGAFLKASLDAPLAYINEYLGYFRTSANQHSANPMGRPMKLAHTAYIGLAIAARRIGQITPDSAATVLAGLCPTVLARYGQEADLTALNATMLPLAKGEEGAEAAFLLALEDYLGKKAHG
jgi:hypothetical protein